MTNEQWADKIVCRYADGHEAKQRLWDGEDKVLVAEITRLRQVLSEAALSAAEPSVAVKALEELLEQAEHVCLGAHTPCDIRQAAKNLAGPIKQARSALAAQVQDVAVPEGWQLVPKIATVEMETAALKKVRPYHDISDRDWRSKMPKDLFRLAWPSMLAAAPAKHEGKP